MKRWILISVLTLLIFITGAVCFPGQGMESETGGVVESGQLRISVQGYLTKTLQIPDTLNILTWSAPVSTFDGFILLRCRYEEISKIEMDRFEKYRRPKDYPHPVIRDRIFLLTQEGGIKAVYRYPGSRY